MLIKENKSVYFSKHPLAVRQYHKNKISAKDYNNKDLLSGYNEHVYNAKLQIPFFIKKIKISIIYPTLL